MLMAQDDGMPRDAAGPVFQEPWEAQAFALAVKLHDAGHFTWPEWAAALSAQIKAAQAAGDPDLGRTYYHHWLAALEHLVATKSLTGQAELRLRTTIVAASRHSDHTHAARREPVCVD